MSAESTQTIQLLESQLLAAKADLQTARRDLEMERSRTISLNADLRTSQTELEASKDALARVRTERNAFERDCESLRNKLTLARREEAKQWESAINDVRNQLRETEVWVLYLRDSDVLLTWHNLQEKLAAANAELDASRRNEDEYLRTIETALLGNVHRQIINTLATHPKR